MDKIYKAYYNSEIGLIEITGTVKGILSLDFIEEKYLTGDASDKGIPSGMIDCLKQLDEYFKGERKEFNLSIITVGTNFQLKVWKQLQKIPYGKTFSYKNIATKSGNIKAVRAVGNANNKNKIAIIIPCHRVIGSNKKLIGYAGGLWRKEWLLNHEREMTSRI